MSGVNTRGTKPILDHSASGSIVVVPPSNASRDVLAKIGQESQLPSVTVGGASSAFGLDGDRGFRISPDKARRAVATGEMHNPSHHIPVDPLRLGVGGLLENRVPFASQSTKMIDMKRKAMAKA